ncbi:MAG: MgtC/SapB family protein [Clostridiales bacterium]|nr:MgtC/SapB family protein [Clostridiales bacterium]
MFPENIPISWIAIRIGAALLAGIIIGFEREMTHHPAGIKTHTLVCIGAALAGIITCEMAHDVAQSADYMIKAADPNFFGRVNFDISRIAAGVVTGIGFIGAGAIVKSKDGTIVTGITTAATLWVTANIGLAIGMGYLWVSLIAVFVVFISNVAIKYLENNYLAKSKVRTIDVIVTKKRETMQAIEEYCAPRRIKIKNFEYLGKIEDLVDGEDAYNLRYTVKTPSGMSFMIVLQDLANNENILQVMEAPTVKEKKKNDKNGEQTPPEN